MTRRIQIERAAELEIAEITIALRERQPASATKVLVPPGERLLTSPHVRARGIERQRIFQADAEREDFVQRLAGLAETKALTVYAWALLPNHFHLLVRTKRQPLARSMRSLLAGYGGAFNRRYRRSGHVFQNRYKSVVCDEAVYFLALVRSLHLNPLRARSVADLEGLAKYAYSEPVVLVETRAYGWQDTEAVLTQFGMIRRRAQREYLRFVAAGVSQGRRVELQGAG